MNSFFRSPKNVTTTDCTPLAWTQTKVWLWFSQITNTAFGLTSRIFCSTPPLTPAIIAVLLCLATAINDGNFILLQFL